MALTAKINNDVTVAVNQVRYDRIMNGDLLRQIIINPATEAAMNTIDANVDTWYADNDITLEIYNDTTLIKTYSHLRLWEISSNITEDINDPYSYVVSFVYANNT